MDGDACCACELGLALVAGVKGAIVSGGGGDDQEISRLGGMALRACDGEDLAVALGYWLVDRERGEGGPDGVEALVPESPRALIVREQDPGMELAQRDDRDGGGRRVILAVRRRGPLADS